MWHARQKGKGKKKKKEAIAEGELEGSNRKAAAWKRHARVNKIQISTNGLQYRKWFLYLGKAKGVMAALVPNPPPLPVRCQPR